MRDLSDDIFLHYEYSYKSVKDDFHT